MRGNAWDIPLILPTWKSWGHLQHWAPVSNLPGQWWITACQPGKAPGICQSTRPWARMQHPAPGGEGKSERRKSNWASEVPSSQWCGAAHENPPRGISVGKEKGFLWVKWILMHYLLWKCHRAEPGIPKQPKKLEEMFCIHVSMPAHHHHLLPTQSIRHGPSEAISATSPVFLLLPCWIPSHSHHWNLGHSPFY